MLERILAIVLEIGVGAVLFFLILKYLIPLLPAPFSTIMLIVLVVCAIVWLIGFLIPRIRVFPQPPQP